MTLANVSYILIKIINGKWWSKNNWPQTRTLLEQAMNITFYESSCHHNRYNRLNYHHVYINVSHNHIVSPDLRFCFWTCKIQPNKVFAVAHVCCCFYRSPSQWLRIDHIIAAVWFSTYTFQYSVRRLWWAKLYCYVIQKLVIVGGECHMSQSKIQARTIFKKWFGSMNAVLSCQYIHCVGIPICVLDRNFGLSDYSEQLEVKICLGKL